MEKAIDFRFDTPAETGLLLSEEVKKANYTYLIFLRYYGCTSCQIDLMDLSAAYDKFVEKGAQILVVLQSKPEILARGIDAQGIPFKLISDPEQKLYPLYNVKAAEDREGMRAGMTPEHTEKFMAKIERGKAAGLEHGEYEGNEYQLPGYFIIDSEMNLLKEHRAANLADMPIGVEYLELI